MSAILTSLNTYVERNGGTRPLRNRIPAAPGSGAVATAAGREAGRMLGDFLNKTRTAPKTPASVAPVATTTVTRPWKTYEDIDALVAQIPVGPNGRARFALPRTRPDSAGNMITFFKVYTVRGQQRIAQLIAQGGADYDEIRLSADHQYAAARHILDDVKAAQALYGHSTNTCGRCGRALSNDLSRDRGIGPECWTK